MNRAEFTVHSRDIGSVQTAHYDIQIDALGYESRATALLDLRSPQETQAVSYGFDYGHVGAYERNRQQFLDYGVQLREGLKDNEFEQALAQDVAEAAKLSGGEAFRILVNISCFNRYRLAAIVSCMRQLATHRKVVADFFYSVAAFQPPGRNHVPNSIVGPVHPLFAGWSRVPANPTAAVVGLGYEQDQALGVVEYVQANPVWALFPNSSEARYVPAVERANKLLLEELPEQQVVPYFVEKPADAFRTVEGLTRGLLHDYNVVLVPFGPKVFVLLTLLVAWRHPTAAVWRVSPGARIEPVDRLASGFCTAFTVASEPAAEAIASSS